MGNFLFVKRCLAWWIYQW